MRNESELYSRQRDRVTPPVRNQTLAYAGVGIVISLVLRTFLDWQVDPADAEAWWNGVQSFVVPAIPAATALFGSIRGAYIARRRVTPVDDPRGWDPVSGDVVPLEPRRVGGTTFPQPERNRPRRDTL